MITGEQEPDPKRLVLLHGEIKTPPIGASARRRIGSLLRHIQNGNNLGMPISRPMPPIGPNCHELRISDEAGEVRVIYQIRPTLVLIGDVFRKTTQKTPKRIIDQCRRRFEQAE